MPDDKKAHKASADTLAHIDELLDEALKQTFPASDPVAINIERASPRHVLFSRDTSRTRTH